MATALIAGSVVGCATPEVQTGYARPDFHRVSPAYSVPDDLEASIAGNVSRMREDGPRGFLPTTVSSTEPVTTPAPDVSSTRVWLWIGQDLEFMSKINRRDSSAESTQNPVASRVPRLHL